MAEPEPAHDIEGADDLVRVDVEELGGVMVEAAEGIEREAKQPAPPAAVPTPAEPMLDIPTKSKKRTTKVPVRLVQITGDQTDDTAQQQALKVAGPARNVKRANDFCGSALNLSTELPRLRVDCKASTTKITHCTGS